MPVYRWVLPEDVAPVRRLVAAIVAGGGRRGDVHQRARRGQPARRRRRARAARAELVAALDDRVLAVAVGPVTAGPLDAAGIPSRQPERARLGALAREVVARLPERDPVLAVGAHTLQVRGHAAVARRPAGRAGARARWRCCGRWPTGPGTVVPRADLVGSLPGGGDGHAVEMAVARLRAALGAPVVETVVKRGYRLSSRRRDRRSRPLSGRKACEIGDLAGDGVTRCGEAADTGVQEARRTVEDHRCDGASRRTAGAAAGRVGRADRRLDGALGRGAALRRRVLAGAARPGPRRGSAPGRRGRGRPGPGVLPGTGARRGRPGLRRRAGRDPGRGGPHGAHRRLRRPGRRERGAADEVAEAAVLAARAGAEEWRVRHLGYLVAEAAVSPDLDAGVVHRGLALAASLTGRQLAFLAAVGRRERQPLPMAPPLPQDPRGWREWGALEDVTDLQHRGLLDPPPAQPRPGGAALPRLRAADLRLTRRGVLVHRLLALDLLHEHRVIAALADLGLPRS